MSPVAAPSRAPQRRPAPQPRPEVRPDARRRHLRVVGPGERTRRRLTPAAGVLLTGLVFLTLFALAIAHTVLVQGQMRLDRLDDQLTAEQARYQELRTTVAELESPVRVVSAAEQLGMVSPDDLVYLQPSAPDPAPAAGGDFTDADGADGPDGTSGGQGAQVARLADGSWSAVKPLLGVATP